jgi:hypothetical protein
MAFWKSQLDQDIMDQATPVEANFCISHNEYGNPEMY